MTFLTVTSHPDDEILGFGGSSYVLSLGGHRIYNLILSGSVEARLFRPDIEKLRKHISTAQNIIGAFPAIIGSFPNLKFNIIPHVELVQFIEKNIIDIQPDIILTHHPYDLNNDHYHTSKACQAAVRLFQRRNCKPIKAFYFMEISSSTDWSFSLGSQQFRADTFVEIGEQGLEKKIQAMYAYEGVMRYYPHPRSEESIRALALLRGSQVGRKLCEGFQTAMNILNE